MFSSSKLKSITLLTSLATAIVSCGSQEMNDMEIYGGSKVEIGDWASTVAIVDSSNINCTGTLVHPQLVITAAHCMQGVWSAKQLSIYTGEGVEGGRTNGQHKVASFASSPKYGRKQEGWNDIAYIVLSEPLNISEKDLPKILLDQDEMEEIIEVGNEVRLVGYGGRNGGGYGVKYEVDAEITKFNDSEINIGKNGRDSCQGDSGGPAYGQLRDGSWRVFGVVSRGGACGKGGIWGRMSANICWIQEDSGIQLGANCS